MLELVNSTNLLIIFLNIFLTFQGQNNFFTFTPQIMFLFSTLASSTMFKNYSGTFLEHFKNRYVTTRWMMLKTWLPKLKKL